MIMLQEDKRKKSGKTIGIIGNGSWGTALAKILTDNGRPIRWWFRNPQTAEQVRLKKQNPHYLSSVKFPGELIAPTDDLRALVRESDTIVLSVPSAYIESLLDGIDRDEWADKVVVSAIKGILPQSNLLLHEYMQKHKDMVLENYVVISGPCHAEEVAQERLSYLTFSGIDPEITASVSKDFENDYIRRITNHDVYGVQMASVLKNVYAIGAGIAHGLDYGDNFLSVYASNAFWEMHGFLTHVFQHQYKEQPMPDFHSSAYLGDLLVTCYSLHSRNRSFGNMLGKGYTVKNATLEMNMVAEGYYGARGTMHICEAWSYTLPIAQSIYGILWENQSPATTFKALESTLH